MSTARWALVLFLLAAVVSFGTPCTTTDQIRFLQCKGYILMIQDILKTYAAASDKLPPLAVFQNISKLCSSAVTCTEKIQCVEAKRGVGLLNASCEGIELSSGAFGECMAKLQANPADSKKYPCSSLFEKDALDSKSKRCRMFTDDVVCIETLSREQCGAPAADAFRRGIPSMKTLLKC